MAEVVKSAAEMRDQLVSKASTDAQFRARLLSDPDTAIKEELGVTIPAGFTVKVHENAADMGHLVIPAPAELSEEELQLAAAAWGGPNDQPLVLDWG